MIGCKKPARTHVRGAPLSIISPIMYSLRTDTSPRAVSGTCRSPGFSGSAKAVGGHNRNLNTAIAVSRVSLASAALHARMPMETWACVKSLPANKWSITMNRRATFVLSVISLLGFAVALPTGQALAQQKQQVSFKSPAANTKYTQQTTIDVGDVPGHQVRVFEIHRTYPSDAPVFNGLKLIEMWTRGITDFTDGTGSSVNYSVYIMENGDKFFSRTALVAQGLGSGKFTTASAGSVTGGTGKLVGIQGIVRTTGAAQPTAGMNENQTDIEYWMPK
jgi:hypothetical protein